MLAPAASESRLLYNYPSVPASFSVLHPSTGGLATRFLKINYELYTLQHKTGDKRVWVAEEGVEKNII